MRGIPDELEEAGWHYVMPTVGDFINPITKKFRDENLHDWVGFTIESRDFFSGGAIVVKGIVFAVNMVSSDEIKHQRYYVVVKSDMVVNIENLLAQSQGRAVEKLIQEIRGE